MRYVYLDQWLSQKCWADVPEGDSVFGCTVDTTSRSGLCPQHEQVILPIAGPDGDVVLDPGWSSNVQPTAVPAGEPLP